MILQTLRDSIAVSCHVKQDGFACLDEGQSDNPLGSRMAKVKPLRKVFI